MHILTQHLGIPQQEAKKKENIAMARNHEAYERVAKTEAPAVDDNKADPNYENKIPREEKVDPDF